MSYEVYAHSEWRMPIGHRESERRFISDLIEDDRLSGAFRAQLLTQALVTKSKDYARMGERPDRPAQGLRKMIEEKTLDRFFSLQISSYFSSGALSLLPMLPDLSVFPSNSWAIKLDFTLRKAYLSKDDREFYILDNPVRKEWVFQVPYIAPSQWKGVLRAAMVQELKRWWGNLSAEERAARIEDFAKRRFRMTLLFGDEKGEEPGSLKGLAKYLDNLGGERAANLYREKVKQFFKAGAESSLPHHQGWLHFYSTYFDRIGLEVINPHPRDTGAGKQPIYFECVPAGSEDDPTRGTFTLLYVPLGEVTEDEMKADFRAVAEGLKAMFTVYGFGAKTSSGFGRAEVRGIQVNPERWREAFLRIWNEAKAAGGR